MALIDFEVITNNSDELITTVNADKIVSVSVYHGDTVITTVSGDVIKTREPRAKVVQRWQKALDGKRQEIKSK